MKPHERDWPTLSPDTTPEAEQRAREAWQKLPIAERIVRVCDLCDSVRHLAKVGLRKRFPEADEHEIKMRMASAWLDRETMIRVYDWDPVEHGATA